MHSGAELPLAPPDLTMDRALIVMTEKRFGALAVTDGARLLGVVTDGDLRRAMGPDLLGRRVSEIMNTVPKTIGPEALAEEALRAMNAESRPVTALFVVDEARMIHGILHIHDLLRAGVGVSPAARDARERMLDGLRRRNPEGASTARRSITVTIFKKLLPAAADCAAGGAGDCSQPARRPARPTASPTTSATPARPTPPRTCRGRSIMAVDQRGQPFTLTADAATDQGADDVALRQPEGDITLNSGAWLMLKSSSGLFRQKSQQLGLAGDVTLYRNDGTTMTGTGSQHRP